jgi:hypothetical protein
MCLADLEVIFGRDEHAIREEGGAVDVAAGFEDEVFKQKVHFRDGDFDPGDRDVLDAAEEEGEEDVDAVGE